MRVVAGTARGRRLEAPPGSTVRPTTDRVRESVFNSLGSSGLVVDAAVLDLFAGVGTMGLEAASRGASKVWLVEQDRDVFELLRGNIEELGLAGRAVPVKADALGETALATVDQPLDVVFLDPPFEMVRGEEGLGRVLAQARRLRAKMKPKSFLVLRLPEIEGEGPKIDGFDGPEHRRYGNEQHVMLYCPSKENP